MCCVTDPLMGGGRGDRSKTCVFEISQFEQQIGIYEFGFINGFEVFRFYELLSSLVAHSDKKLECAYYLCPTTPHLVATCKTG